LKDLAWFEIESDDSRYRIRNLSEREDGGPSWSDRNARQFEHPAILLSGILWRDRDHEFGALVTIKYEDERTIQAGFLGSIFISRELGEIPREVMQRMWTSESSRQDISAIWGAARRIGEKLWYIS
jgi:hypothetical protein